MLFAVLGAILGQQQMVQIDFLALFLVVGVSSVVLVLPVNRLMRWALVGEGHRRSLVPAQTERSAGSGEADAPPPDPRRPAPPQALDAPGAPPVLARRRRASRACGRARASTSRPSSAPPRRRSPGRTCACASSASSVLLLFGVLVLRLWTLQVVEGKTYAAAVTRNQVRVVSIPAPRGEIVDRNGTVLVSNIPQQEILLSRAEAAQNPGIIGHGGRARRPDAGAGGRASINNNQYSPYEPVPVAVGVSADTVQYLQTHQSEYPGVSVQTLAQRTYPQGGTTAPHVLGYVGAHLLELPGRPPQRRLHPGQPDRRVGDRGAVRALPARRRRAPGALGRRQRHRGRHPQHDRAADRRHHRCSTSTPGCSRRSRTTCRTRSWPTATRSTPSTGKYPPATNGAVVVMNPQNGQVLAMASYPSYDLNEWVGGISTANFTALQASRGREQLRH